MKADALDQKIIHSFTMAYWELNKRKIINNEELEEILNIIDKLEEYNPQELENELNIIFKKQKN